MLIGVLILYSVGMYMWGYHTALSDVKSDMRYIEKRMQESKRCDDAKERGCNG